MVLRKVHLFRSCKYVICGLFVDYLLCRAKKCPQILNIQLNKKQHFECIFSFSKLDSN